jgi:hypothetical protein
MGQGRERGWRRPVSPPVGTAQGDGGEDPEPSKASLLCLIDGFGTLQLTVFKQLQEPYFEITNIFLFRIHK